MTFLLIAIGIILAIIVSLFFIFKSEPTCFDGKKNQKEEGIDCGGPCKPCVTNPKDMTVLWTRVFEIKEGVYEAAALIENPNLFYELPSFKYIFKIYGSNNDLVAIQEGQSALNPRDKFVIFVTNLDTGKRRAVKAFLEVDYLSDWIYNDKEKSPLVVSEKHFRNIPFSSLNVKLQNDSLFPVEDIEASAVLYDEKGNAIGVSSTHIDSIPAESGRSVSFTWSKSFEKEPFSSEVFTKIGFNSR